MTNKTVCANSKTREVRAAIYCRLSKDDANEGTSASIQNQEELLRGYCKEQGWNVAGVFRDDGYSGMNQNRPGFQRMLSEIEQGKFDVVLTKDLSRLGRDYADTGKLIGETFPKKRIRYIAVNDSVDTSQFRSSGNDMMALKTVMNEYYSRDVSSKVHSSYMTKAKSGKFTGCLAPFGYKKDPDDKNHLIIDDDTAWIVRKIFEMALDGRGANYIRRKLEEMEVPCPAWWNRQKGLRNHVTKFEKADPERGRFMWDFTTIKEILSNPVYVGAIASQKADWRFKIGWMGDKKAEDWIVVENMHEALIDRETYDIVQEKVESRKRPDAFGNFSLFAGVLKCGQCGSALSIRRASPKTNDRVYTCSRYNKYGVAHCSQHRIPYDTLYNIVLDEIRKCACQALSDEQDAAEELRAQFGEDAERQAIERSIAADTERIRSLERVIERLYSDVTDGKITEENFTRILDRSQAEQETLRHRVALNSERLEQETREQQDRTRFLELIRDYADIRELDAATLNHLVRKIVIQEDIDGDAIRQTVEIHFNFNNQADKVSLIRK